MYTYANNFAVLLQHQFISDEIKAFWISSGVYQLDLIN